MRAGTRMRAGGDEVQNEIVWCARWLSCGPSIVKYTKLHGGTERGRECVCVYKYMRVEGERERKKDRKRTNSSNKNTEHENEPASGQW
jgi:hypothetical protein